MDDDQQFCLRWNNHQSTLVAVFDTLLEKGMHVDCTLAAEGQTLKAHKVVLSACSPYFESVLSQQYDKHPIIILKDVKYAELRAMMDYMYRGEVNISQDQLAALLKAAESLQIKGLSDNKPSRPPSRPAPPAQPHPPRASSPPPQVREGSIDSREGSVSPTRRRKKARRMSGTAAEPLAAGHSNGVVGSGLGLGGVGPVVSSVIGPIEPPCKEETSRDPVEDLTLDEELQHDDTPTHNDVVRNFQWHMERSQDELMNSSDNVRDSQGRRTQPQNIMTRSKKVTVEEPVAPPASSIATFAILKTVKSPPPVAAALVKAAAAVPTPEDAKENKKFTPKSSPHTPVAVRSAGSANSTKSESKYNIFPRSERLALPCAQYKTEKGYRCPTCQRCYNARKNLVRHVTLECGREPKYRCPYCSYSKHRRNELKKHMEKKHPDLRPLSPPPGSPDTPDHCDDGGTPTPTPRA